MTLTCITPDAVYHQGIHRSWLRRTTFDFYFPEFAGLGEQEIYRAEVYADGSQNDEIVFGYTGRYNELRYLPNSVHSLLTPGKSLQHWTAARHFTAPPVLSGSFLSMMNASVGLAPDLTRPWAVQDTGTTPPWVVQYAHLVHASRPLPYLAEPAPILGG